MAKKTVDDLNFNFGDDGELELSGFDEDDEFADDESDEIEDDGDVVVEGDDEDVEDKSSDLISLATRVGGIEATLQALPQMIANSISGAMTKGKKDEDEEEIPDELDSKQIVNILSKRIDKVIGDRLGSVMEQHQPALQQAKATADFQSAAAKHGQKFIDKMPQVAKIMLKSNGSLNVEQAWDIVKDFQPTFNRLSKEELIAKARKAKVDADSKDAVGDIDSARTKFKKLEGKNDSEIFDKAFNAAMMKAARGSKRAA